MHCMHTCRVHTHAHTLHVRMPHMAPTRRLDKQLGADAHFLKASGVMDYSLLLGVHFCKRGQRHMDAGVRACVCMFACVRACVRVCVGL